MTMQIIEKDSARKRPLIGTKITFTSRQCRCGCGIAIITEGDKGLEARCVDCGASRGLISERTADIIDRIVAHFGAPDTPLILRRNPEQN
jgi:anaerobic selenocysteine-containing dehydrogenase